MRPWRTLNEIERAFQYEKHMTLKLKHYPYDLTRIQFYKETTTINEDEEELLNKWKKKYSKKKR